MNFDDVFKSLIGSGPVAVLLLYWVWSERAERRQQQEKLIEVLETYAGVSEATRDEILAMKRAIRAKAEKER